MDPEIWELLEAGESGDEVAAILRLGPGGRLPDDVRPVAQLGEIVTVRMRRGAIPGVREAAECTSMKSAGAPLGPDLEFEANEVAEVAAPEWPRDERRPGALAATGRGVIVGVIDWGFDFAHPDFIDARGKTRVLALWDQRGGERPDSPQPYGYGREHTREEIQRALATSNPYSTLGYHPCDADSGCGAHGTHVASIAAGSGGSGRPAGIAPDAELIFVHLATWGSRRAGKLGDSVTLLEAIEFISRTAGDRPWVINLSMGRHGEQHDGTTLVEQGLDAALRSAPGRAICQSAGNYFHRRIHASGQLRPGERRAVFWQIEDADVTPNELEIWYSWRDTFEVELRSPDRSSFVRARVGERVLLSVNGREVGKLYHRVREPNTLDNHVAVFLYKGAPAGDWEVTLCAADVIDGRYHAWIERDSACRSCQSSFRAEDADACCTTGTICNGMRTISVGAYNAHEPDEPLAPFSSSGPTRDGRIKPDLCAPGVAILAARSAPRKPATDYPLLTRMSGTSMASPHVAGTVALMFEVAPRRLRIEETHNLLLGSARKISSENVDRVGSGFLDIHAAVNAARQISDSGVAAQSPSSEQASSMNTQDTETSREICPECASRQAAAHRHHSNGGRVPVRYADEHAFELAETLVAPEAEDTGLWFPMPSFAEDAPTSRVAGGPALVDHLHHRTVCSSTGTLARDADPTVMTPATMNPGFIGNDDEIQFDSALQTALTNLMVTKYSSLLARSSVGARRANKDDKIRVALVDLTGDKLCRPGYAGWGSTVSMSGASTSKIAIFYAAAQLVFDVRQLAKTKHITTTAELLRETAESLKNLRCKPDLRWLFEFDESTNPVTAKASRALSQAMLDVVEERRSTPNASELIMRLGFDYMASVLWQSGLRHPSRGGLWIGSSYCTGRTKAPHNPRCHTFHECPNLPGRFVWNDDALGVRGIVLTALSAVTFFTLLAQGRLVAKAQSEAIEAFLARGCTWYPGALSGATVRAAKCGLTSNLLHDAGLIENGTRRYAIAYATQGANAALGARSSHLQVQLIKDLDQLIADNNP